MSGIVYIMRGLPGSGKSTKADKIQKSYEESYDEVRRLSFDDYFMEDGEYKFSIEKYHGTGGARFQCMVKFLDAISKGYSCIIVDNTHPTWEHCEKYVKVALDNGYEVMFTESDTPWAWDPEECAEKNRHGVPVEEISRRLSIYEKTEDILEKCIEYCNENGIINVEKLQADTTLWGITRRVYPCGLS